MPALLTGFTLAFARGGRRSTAPVIFIAGNLPMKTEITPLLIVIKLEQFEYAAAAALGFIMLIMSFVDAAFHQSLTSLGAAPTRGVGALMAGGPNKALLAELASRPGRDTLASTLIKWTFIGASLLFLAALLFAPLITVFAAALAKGWSMYFASFGDPDTLAAIRLTLTTAAIVVPLNTVFGICAAWAIAKFEFKGKSFLITLIDLPMAVSPVISGLVYVLLFGMQGWFGLWLQENDISIIYRAARHRARDDVRDVPLRRARADSADAAARQRRGRGGDHARRRRPDDVFPCHLAEGALGLGLWRDPL